MSITVYASNMIIGMDRRKNIVKAMVRSGLKLCVLIIVSVRNTLNLELEIGGAFRCTHLHLVERLQFSYFLNNLRGKTCWK